MNKVFAIVCIALLVLGLHSVACADYIMRVTATNTTNSNYGNPVLIGVGSDAQIGTSQQSWQVGTLAYAAQVIFAVDGSKLSLLKKNIVKATDEDELRNIYLQVWAGSYYEQTTFDLRFWGNSPRQLTAKMVYDPFGIIAAGTVLSNQSFTPSGVQDSPSFKYNLTAYKTDTPYAANNGYILELSYPEPSSIIALLCGISGMGGLLVRRRRI